MILDTSDRQTDQIKPVQIKKGFSSDLENNQTKMDAIQTFEQILASVKSSQLNFVVKESPFSFDISLKKSFIYRNSATSPTGYIKNSNGWTLPSHTENKSL